MDAERFDAFTRALARRVSRRGLVGGAGGLLALALGARFKQQSEAIACQSDADCWSGFRCCSGECRNVSFDPAHCGRCGVVCKAGERCNYGFCCQDDRTCADQCCKVAGVCAYIDRICCDDAENLCDGHCCNVGEACGLNPDTRLGRECCGEDRQCIATGGIRYCCDPAVATCLTEQGCCLNTDICGTGLSKVCCRKPDICTNGQCFAPEPGTPGPGTPVSQSEPGESISDDSTPQAGAEPVSSEIASPAAIDGDDVGEKPLGCCRCGYDPRTSGCQAANSQNDCTQLCDRKPAVFDAYANCETKNGKGICQSRYSAESGCCTCLADRTKGCANLDNEDACLKYCQTAKKEDIGFQKTKACSVADAGDRYTCKAKPPSDNASCPIPDDTFAYHRQTVGLIDAAPRPEDLGDPSLMRRTGNVAFDLTSREDLSDECRNALSAAGWIGSYSASLTNGQESATTAGVRAFLPAAQIETEKTQVVTAFDAQVVSCIPDTFNFDLCLPPGVANITTVENGEDGTNYSYSRQEESGITSNWQSTWWLNGNTLGSLTVPASGDIDADTNRLATLRETVDGRFRTFDANFAESSFASSRMLLPPGMSAGNVAGIGYRGAYYPAFGDPAAELGRYQQVHALADSAARFEHLFENGAKLRNDLLRFTEPATAPFHIQAIRDQYSFVLQAGGVIDSAPGQAGSDETWTLHHIVVPDDTGAYTAALVSLSYADGGLAREMALTLAGIAEPPGASATEKVQAALGDAYQTVLNYASRQYGCMTASPADYATLCPATDSAVAATVDTGQLVGEEASTTTGEAVALGSDVALARFSMFPLTSTSLPDSAIVEQVHYLVPGSHPGWTAMESQAAVRLNIREGMEEKERRFFGGSATDRVRATFRFDDAIKATEAFRWYTSQPVDGKVTYSLDGEFESAIYEASFRPNFQLGTLPNQDWSMLVMPFGNTANLFAVAGDDRGTGALDLAALDLFSRYRNVTAELDQATVLLTGDGVSPRRAYTSFAVDQVWYPLATDDETTLNQRTSDNPNLFNWGRVTQQIYTPFDEKAEYSLISEWRAYVDVNAATTFMDGNFDRLNAAFPGISLVAITEDDVLLKPTGQAERVDAYLSSFTNSEGAGSSGLLVYAQIGLFVAVINLRAQSDFFNDPDVVALVAWMLREGGLPLATLGIAIMQQYLAAYTSLLIENIPLENVVVEFLFPPVELE